MSTTFADTVITWHRQHGRHDLPWQQRDAYCIWVSEIMLQQTQVSTVIPYYHNFMARFPNVITLADAPQDDVLAQWSGLGYYARARNLHAAAKIIRDEHAGVFPTIFEQVNALPGIGRSTAGAILSLAHQQRHAILDGNVKRVLARYHAVAGWPGKTAVAEQLWQKAEQHTPDEQCNLYTQAMMDLGATLCTRSKPNCTHCPIASGCKAFAQNAQADFPGKKPRKTLPTRQATLLIIRNPAGEILLEQRPPSGIWGSLWSLPEIPADCVGNCADMADWSANTLGIAIEQLDELPAFEHIFSHFRLHIQPLNAVQSRQAQVSVTKIMDAPARLWYNTQQLRALGLPAPIRKLLNADKGDL